jgi:hypothetical protein
MRHATYHKAAAVPIVWEPLSRCKHCHRQPVSVPSCDSCRIALTAVYSSSLIADSFSSAYTLSRSGAPCLLRVAPSHSLHLRRAVAHGRERT